MPTTPARLATSLTPMCNTYNPARLANPTTAVHHAYNPHPTRNPARLANPTMAVHHAYNPPRLANPTMAVPYVSSLLIDGVMRVARLRRATRITPSMRSERRRREQSSKQPAHQIT